MESSITSVALQQYGLSWCRGFCCHWGSCRWTGSGWPPLTMSVFKDSAILWAILFWCCHMEQWRRQGTGHCLGHICICSPAETGIWSGIHVFGCHRWLSEYHEFVQPTGAMLMFGCHGVTRAMLVWRAYVALEPWWCPGQAAAKGFVWVHGPAAAGVCCGAHGLC